MRTPSPYTCRTALVLTALLFLALNGLSFAGSQPAFVREKLVKVEKIWPGQRLTLYVTLYTTTPFSGSTRFELPKVSGMLIMENEDRPLLGTEKIDGVSYIFKRHEIALFPLRSGSLTMPAFTVEFGFRGENGKVVDQSFTSRQLQFSVLEIPGADPQKPVITTANLQVKDQWNPEPGKAKVGDALTRTITMTADDLPGMAFPPLNIEKIDGLGVYQKQPRVNDQMQRGAFTGQRTETITYVCEKQGKFTLPGMHINWWNPKNEELKVIKLKPVTLEVAANPLLETEDQPGAEQQSPGSFSWKLASIALLFFALAIIGLLWLLRLKKQQPSSPEPSEADLFKQFHRASTSSDAAKTMQALMRWLDCSGLTGVSGRLDLLVSMADNADLGLQVQALETVLFSPEEIKKGAESWSADGLYRA
ncbi:MAG: BatD family protein, partial [Proteobacteria bacterium]|nr:BatD family protein [Pseudomonadota bacterium]